MELTSDSWMHKAASPVAVQPKKRSQKMGQPIPLFTRVCFQELVTLWCFNHSCWDFPFQVSASGLFFFFFLSQSSLAGSENQNFLLHSALTPRTFSLKRFSNTMLCNKNLMAGVKQPLFQAHLLLHTVRKI